MENLETFNFEPQNKTGNNAMLELVDVKKLYVTKAGNTAALDGVSLVFPEKGMIFITGKSGSGKTTMLNVIGGLDGIDSGEILVSGKKFSEFTQKEYDSYRNTLIGFVFQEYNLLPDYTIEKNVGMANELQGKPINREDLENMLESVGIEKSYAGRHPNQLSGGQKQRVAIARALIKNPKIIMADEPTGALDSVTGIQVMEELKKLSQEKLVIVVSHDLELANNYADRIIRLVDGKVAEDYTIKNKEIKENVYENDGVLTVKMGSNLSQEETERLVTAIRENKKIKTSDKLSVKVKRKTDQSKVEKNLGDISFISSKMKYKSAAELGLKSLKVKPLRLIFTILLSAIAFAVFGVFDTIAAYERSKVISNLLQTGDYQTISAYAEYAPENRETYRINVSQETISELNEQTGYNFRGVYHVSDFLNSGNINPQVKTMYNLDVKNANGMLMPNVALGAGYYQPYVNGVLEFSENEIEVNKIKEYGYTIMCGHFPKLRYDAGVLVKESLYDIAISRYLAETLMYRAKGEPTLFDEPITEISQFLGKKIRLGSGTENAFTIAGIIDCGPIPEKYQTLANQFSSNANKALRTEFASYLNSTANLMVFVPEGFVKLSREMQNKPVSYYADPATYKMEYSKGQTRASASSEFYRAEEFSLNNVILFENPDASLPDANNPEKDMSFKLKEGEVIISIENLDKMLLPELNAGGDNVRVKINKLLAEIKAGGIYDKCNALRTLFGNGNYLDSLRGELGTPDKFNREITLHKSIEARDMSESYTFKVVGIHFGMNYSVLSEGFKGIMLSDADLAKVGAYKGQGNYVRLFGKVSSEKKSNNVLAKLMVAETGLKINWYGNDVLSTIASYETTILQFADLFLYAALVLALFSVFMLFNYISTSIVSKRQSIGVLRALGSGGADVFKMFITESVIIAIINGILASIFAGVACIFVNMYLKDIMSLGINFAIYGVRQVLVIFAISIVTAVASSIIPILKIAKEKPVDLIRRA